ncbi:hypothetical protein FACS1894184_08490 [Clostridia bacterium]|nr:hypothetical protein FACS1894184_08490 [Clostridia bacterium]
MAKQLTCPNCGKHNIVALGDKKHLSLGKLVAGAATGGVSLLATGLSTKKHDVMCQDCGRRWEVK